MITRAQPAAGARRLSAPTMGLMAIGAGLLGVCNGCERSGQVAAEAGRPEIAFRDLADRYRLTGSVTLEQPDSALIVRVSGVDRDPNGMIALGDASEGNVKLYSRSGRLLRILGRKGDGPGEFREPRFPRFRGDGTIHIADAGNGRVSVFTTEGKLLRTFQLGRLEFPSSFLLDGRGGYVVAGEDAEGYVLFQFDSTGRQVRHFQKIRDVLPRGRGDTPYWRNVRSIRAAAFRDTAYVTLTYSDSLWWVSLLDGTEGAIAITPPAYTVPAPPLNQLKTLADLKAWSDSLQMTASIQAAGAGMVVNFVKGVLNFGDPNTAVIRTADGEWLAVNHAPAFIAADADRLVTLASAGDSVSGNVVLGFYQPRPARTGGSR